MQAIRTLWILSGLIAFSCARAQTPSPTPGTPSASTQTNRLEAVELRSSDVFFTAVSDSPSMQQMRARLADPAQRAALRAEQRAQIEASHADLADALSIDAAEEQALIELLTDQQLEQFEDFYGRIADQSFTPQTQMADQAQRQTRRIEALRELLGQDKLERYQDFERTLAERRQVSDLNARLDSAHKLQPDQRDRMIALWRDHNRRALDAHRDIRHIAPLETLRSLPSREELQRFSQLQTIAANEDLWRRRSDADRSLRTEAATFLTQPQLAALALMQAEAADSLKRWIQQARLEAGLTPEIPEGPKQSAPPPRTRLGTDVRVTVRLSIDTEPTFFTQVVRNGQSTAFAATQGLLVEVTPTLYDDNMFDLRMTYYEQGSAGKRPIGETGAMGTWTREAPLSTMPEHHGSSATVITGRKGYAIEVSSSVEPI